MSPADEYGRELPPRLLLAVGIALLLVTGLVVGGGVSYLLWATPDETEAADDGCARDRTVELTVALEMYDVVNDAVDDVAPACTSVRSTARSGAEVALGVSTGGALPDIWIPESRIWLGRARLGEEARVRVLAPSLARTPVLLVGGPRGRRFATWGDAEASGLVSVPDPEVSTVGALALVAPLAEARVSGRTLAEARQMVVPFAQTYGARRARGADAQVWPTMFRSLSPRLVVTTEQELALMQDGRRLRDLTPDVGAPVLDFPLAVREDAAPGARQVALALLDHLMGEDGARALVEQGLRPPRGAAPAATRSDVSAYLPTPTARTVVTAVQSWQTLAVPSAILAVVDASGSMDFDAGTGTRMDLLADAALIGLSFLPDHARVGLWIFSIDKGGPGQDWRVLEPIRRLDDLRFGRTQRYALRERASEMSSLTDGGTGLYDTALAAYREAVRSYRRNYSNAVVLMTDGRNDDPGSIGLEDLLVRLEELRDPDRPVRIVGIAISEDADLAALQRMAQVTGGEAYLAAQPEDILGVFARAVLSR
jgi:Mg-chelatase subunit ChlD